MAEIEHTAENDAPPSLGGQPRKSRTGQPCPRPEKTRYRNERQAEKRLAKAGAKFGDQGTLHVYECACGYWHLGRSSAKWLKFNELAR